MSSSSAVIPTPYQSNFSHQSFNYNYRTKLSIILELTISAMLFIITSLTDLVSVTLFFVVGHTLFPAGLGYKYSSVNIF